MILKMSENHAFTGLFPGDYLIHLFDFDGYQTFAYGFLRNITASVQYEADYQCQQPPSQPIEMEKESHRVVGRISKKAYSLARLRNWPNTQAEVDEIVAYSGGKRIQLSFRERIQLFLA